MPKSVIEADITDLVRLDLIRKVTNEQVTTCITSAQEYQTTINLISSNEYPSWAIPVAKTELNETGGRTFDSSGNLISEMPHTEQERIDRQQMNQMLIDNANNMGNNDPVPPLTNAEIELLVANGYQIEQQTEGVLLLTNDTIQIRYDAAHKFVEQTTIKNGNWEYIEQHGFTTNQLGQFVPDFVTEKSVSRDKDYGYRLSVCHTKYKNYYYGDQTAQQKAVKNDPKIKPQSQQMELMNGKYKEVALFPNPTTQTLYVTLNNEMMDKTKSDLTISDLSGRMVQQWNDIESNMLTIDVANYPTGVYWVKITQNGIQSVKKFIKH